ncbi:MAG: hypothetical protein PGN34_23800 [Methylobacterium frigidaeris]
MIRFAVPVLLAAGLSAPALAQSGPFASATGRPPALLMHGNYCGPGNNAPLPPIDALDAACARHDACTPRGGLPSRTCNLRLQREAELVARDPRQPEDLRAMAGFIAVGTGIIPSDPDVPGTSAPAAAVGHYRPVAHDPAPVPFGGLDPEDGDD